MELASRSYPARSLAMSYLDGGNFIPAGMSGSNPASLMKLSLAFRSLHQNSRSPSVISPTSSRTQGSSSLCSLAYLILSASSWA